MRYIGATKACAFVTLSKKAAIAPGNRLKTNRALVTRRFRSEGYDPKPFGFRALSHTNRIDVEFGQRLFRHLLRLPLPISRRGLRAKRSRACASLRTSA